MRSRRTFLPLSLALAFPLCLASLAGCGSEEHNRHPRDVTSVRVIGPDGKEVGGAQKKVDFPVAPVAQQPLPSDADRNLRVTPAQPVPRIAIAAWRERWPDAAKELDEWAAHHPSAAEAFFAWDAAHDDRAEALIEWAIGNPVENFEAFLLTRHDWDSGERAMHEREHRAVGELLEMIRRNSNAWVELAHHPHGVAWLGTHAPHQEALADTAVAQTQPVQAAPATTTAGKSGGSKVALAKASAKPRAPRAAANPADHANGTDDRKRGADEGTPVHPNEETQAPASEQSSGIENKNK